MTDTSSTPTTSSTPPPGRDSQAVVAIITVCGMIILGVALIVGAWLMKDGMVAGMCIGAVGTLVGALANSLNSPTGVANVLRAGKQAPDPAPVK